jgi:hypothetical protein
MCHHGESSKSDGDGGKLVQFFGTRRVCTNSYKVWSFSPPDEPAMLRDPSSSPISMPDEHMSLHSDGDSGIPDGDSLMHDT